MHCLTRHPTRPGPSGLPRRARSALVVVASSLAGSLVTSLATSSAAPAQDRGAPVAPRDVAAAAAMPGPSVAVRDGVVFGRGPGYAVRCDAAGPAFTGSPPAPGATAPVLRYALESVGRRTAGDRLQAVAVGAARPEVDALTVRYVRGACVERYALRADGVEQSFVFDALPAGDGDLVVRGRLATDLVPSAVGAVVDALRFDAADGAAITVGAVTGIDAGGARARGTMRLRDGVLELRLPAAFVRDAALPLVVDPLIASVTRSVFGSIQEAGVAYDAGSDVFVVVESEMDPFYTFPSVSAYRWSATGAPLGAVTLQNGFCSFCLPHGGGAANLDALGVFVVTWGWQPDLSGRIDYATVLDAATGARRGTVTLPFTVYDIGGSWAGDTAVGVASSGFAIEAFQIRVQTGSVPVVGASVTLATRGAALLGDPAIAQTGGADGRYLLAWDQTEAGERNLFGALLDADLQILDRGPLGLSSTPKRFPAVDGDGRSWLVVYETGTFGFGGQTDIGCFGVFWDPARASAYVTGEVIVAGDPSVDERAPQVAWSGDSDVVSYTVGGEARVQTIDPFHCLPCEAPVALGAVRGPLRIGSQKSADPQAGDVVMIRNASEMHWFRSDDGRTTDLGGGCGRGGNARASCARAGIAHFTLRLRDARPFVPAAVVLGTGRLDLPCGPCTLVPNPGTGVVVGVGNTDAHGNAALGVPLPAVPSVVGATVLEQWLTAAGSGCLSAVELSNALQFEIE